MSLAVCLLLLTWSSSVSSGDCHFFQNLFCPVCGSKNPNNNVIDVSEPTNPSTFASLTTLELKAIRAYVQNDPNIKVSKPENATIVTSYLFSADLLLPPKADVLKFLDKNGRQPTRRARVVVFRGDKQPPVVEEYVCSPLPNISKCELLQLSSRKNPVNFNFRPGVELELQAALPLIYQLDQKLGPILLESFGERFTNCTQGRDCLTISKAPVGSGVLQDSSQRKTWLQAEYFLDYYQLHPLGFAVLFESTGSDASQWFISKVWYGDKLFNSVDEFIESYNNGSVTKVKLTKPINDKNLFSSMYRRGPEQPRYPQRPPTLVEPDGKRYSIKNDKVTYLDWTFNYHMSSRNGPAIYDVKFRGERIVYELAVSEIAVIYSGYMPFGNTANYVDSATGMGVSAKGLVPGADCPDTATLVSSVFLSEKKSEPDVYKTSICIFENNKGDPLRRHMSYNLDSGSFYGGMLDSNLVFRTALAVTNYDYIVDFVFHQNGVLEVQTLSAGYVVSVYYATAERPYGFQVYKNLLGNVHHHLFHFKVDLDIQGTSNRYKTLDLKEELRSPTAFPGKPYSQVKIVPTLKRTENEALLKYNFDEPKYHIVYNEARKNKLGEDKAYRLHVQGISKLLLREGVANENTFSWSRYQIVATTQKDGEISSSSPYGMYDSLEPTTNFTTFYSDNESIVDKDLVFWVALGNYHIPSSEDIPTTTTAGHKLSFALSPFNYFEQDPSMGSRDAIVIEHINPLLPPLGVTVDRHGNSRDQCLLPKPRLEEDLTQDPDRDLRSRNL
ncbi:unnamed protein product [Candidula unifasciata]|uniref:Amine oxidase n=1 Tax=Candidula unifasciata TaxID=100452 RepID=A0A8S3ZUJ4_9EUPU|nr:unnamed protein product [Candidula unifasciata]